MKLTMLTGMGGPKTNLTKGDPHECDIDEAARLVRAGFATTTSDKDAKEVADAIAKAEAAEETAAKKAADERAKKKGDAK